MCAFICHKQLTETKNAKCLGIFMCKKSGYSHTIRLLQASLVLDCLVLSDPFWVNKTSIISILMTAVKNICNHSDID